MTTPTKPRSRATLTERCEAAAHDVAVHIVDSFCGGDHDVTDHVTERITIAIRAAVRRELARAARKRGAR